MKWTKLILQDFSFEFSGFYYTSNFLRILRILLHLKQLSHKTKQYKLSENLPFSRNLVIADRKRRGQGGLMWTKNHKRWDANYIAWINLIQSITTHCAKFGLMRLRESYIDSFTAQLAAPGLFGGFSFRGLKKVKGGGFMNPLHSPIKEHSKTEFEKREF